MRELQHGFLVRFKRNYCTKPRLMRELQLRKPWGVKNTRLYQTKTHEGTTTQEACSRIKRLLYQTKTHEGTTTSFLSVFFTNNCTKPRLMRELQPQSATEKHYQNCTKPRLMRELQRKEAYVIGNDDCTKPRLMRELQRSDGPRQ